MFGDYLYLLRSHGLKVSLTEWMTLMDALKRGMCRNLNDFYYISRMILLKSESEYDKYDTVFLEYFHNIAEQQSEPSEQMREWLKPPEMPKLDHLQAQGKLRSKKMDVEKAIKDYKNRIEDQKKKHEGGFKYIARAGHTTFGNSGQKLGGIRVEGYSMHRSAFTVIKQREFKDFREDGVFEMRQFQVALKRMRRYTDNIDLPRTEIDVDETVRKTCDKGGMLHIEMKKPRRNSIKILLLLDSGGSMYPYSKLCNTLFQAVHKMSFFKDIKTYYFHNCIYGKLYNTPKCSYTESVDTTWVLKNCGSDYKVIIVGDATMSPEELFYNIGASWGHDEKHTGVEWLKIIADHFDKAVWLNPNKTEIFEGHYWQQTEEKIQEVFPMFKMSIDGMNDAMHRLMVAK